MTVRSEGVYRKNANHTKRFPQMVQETQRIEPQTEMPRERVSLICNHYVSIPPLTGFNKHGRMANRIWVVSQVSATRKNGPTLSCAARIRRDTRQLSSRLEEWQGSPLREICTGQREKRLIA